MSSKELDCDGMVWVPGGTFSMGSLDFYPEEGPVHQVTVQGLWVDRAHVSNAEFAAFVADTGYVTTAERPLDPEVFPDLDDYSAGSMVFRPTDGPVDLGDWRRWWAWVPGASWRAPRGPGSDLAGFDDHPVVQVSFDDARAYAVWAGKELPTEAEWEHFARGGLQGAVYAWGDGQRIGDQLMANTWQGHFPYENTGARGWVGTSPVGSFPANGYGLLDVTGNVWEWTVEAWSASHASPSAPCCAPLSPVSGKGPRRVLKGGSHLCSPEYCLRYRPARVRRSPRTPRPRTSVFAVSGVSRIAEHGGEPGLCPPVSGRK